MIKGILFVIIIVAIFYFIDWIIRLPRMPKWMGRYGKKKKKDED